VAKSQRTKGAAAERELAKALSEFLNIPVQRNLLQVRDAGHDLTGLPVALEVKRQERLVIGSWWAQACAQADSCGKTPALAYRQSRKPWRFILPMSMLDTSLESNDLEWTMELGIEGFCHLMACSIQTD